MAGWKPAPPVRKYVSRSKPEPTRETTGVFRGYAEVMSFSQPSTESRQAKTLSQPRVSPAMLRESDRRWGVDGVWMVLIVGICVWPMLMGLDKRDTTHTMENLAVFSSQETWLRQHGYRNIEAESDAWLLPSRNGEPRLRKPPLVVWMNLAAWWDLQPGDANATADDLLDRARLVSVAMGCLLIVGVYGVGRTLGDRQTAIIAAVAAGTMLFVQKQARYASYDIYMAAFLAIALWLMLAGMMRGQGSDGDEDSDDETQSNQAPSFWGVGAWMLMWMGSGLALGLAWLSKGPLALVVMGVMIAASAVSLGMPQIYKRLITGGLIMAGVSALVALPWYLWVWQREPGLWGAIGREASHTMEKSDPIWTHLQVIVLVFPWCVWLVGGLFLPWLRLQGKRRRQALVAWVMFVGILVLFTLPSARQPRYVLPIVPAAALLIAQLWRWHSELNETGQRDPGGAVLKWGHVILMGGATLAIGVLLWGRDMWIANGWLSAAEVGAVSPLWSIWAVSLMVGLVIWVGGTMRRTDAGGPIRAAVGTGMWMVVCSSLWWSSYSNAADGQHPARGYAEFWSEIMGEQSVVAMLDRNIEKGINEEFLFYAQRIVPAVEPVAFAGWSQANADIAWVLTTEDAQREAQLNELGWQKMGTAVDDRKKDVARTLGVWHRTAEMISDPR